MCRRLRLALLLCLVLVPAGAAEARTSGKSGTHHRRGHSSQGNAYVNPFANLAWEAGRIDMGMDWAPLKRLPVLAVGDAVILGSDDHSGWPGKHIIWYQLTDGPLSGDVIYVAEHLRKLAPVGKVVKAGEPIAVALPGYPYIEMGWADRYGSPRAYPCYKEGHPTNSGREMVRFLESLGAAGETLKPGPARPAGRRC